MTDAPAPTTLSVERVNDSRLDEVADIFHRHQAGSARSLQTTIGPSQAGHPCDRHLGYTLRGVKPAVPDMLHWAALMGTWGHGGAEGAMHEANKREGFRRFIVEGEAAIEPGLIPRGHTDVYDTTTNEVWDWKFVGESTMKTYRQKGAGRQYLIQAMLYGLGWARAGYPVKAVRIFFLPRWSNEIHDGFDWAVKYNEAIALDAIAHLRTVDAASTIVAGGLAPWTELAEDTTACRFCPWLRRAAPGQARADETGCHGYYRGDEGSELAALGGTQTAGGRATATANAPTGDRMLYLIGQAQHPTALVALWRGASETEWTEVHTAAAARRKAELET